MTTKLLAPCLWNSFLRRLDWSFHHWAVLKILGFYYLENFINSENYFFNSRPISLFQYLIGFLLPLARSQPGIVGIVTQQYLRSHTFLALSCPCIFLYICYSKFSHLQKQFGCAWHFTHFYQLANTFLMVESPLHLRIT